MARITVEDCLERIDNRFTLVLTASRQARKLSYKVTEPSLPPSTGIKGAKDTVVALREIAEGNISIDILEEDAPRSPLQHDYDLSKGFGENSVSEGFDLSPKDLTLPKDGSPEKPPEKETPQE